MDSQVKHALPLWCLLLLTACPGPVKPDAGPACDVAPPDLCYQPDLRFADVKPIFDRHCVPCHYGQLGGPWPLQSYTDIADWHDIVRDDIAFCSMPPADAGTVMTTEEKMKVLDWLRCDFPQ
jgi:hypothetical protein